MKKILYGILGLLSLISLFIIACAFRPELADKISDLLYVDERMIDLTDDDEKNREKREDIEASVLPNRAAGEVQGTGMAIGTGGLTSDEVLGLSAGEVHTGMESGARNQMGQGAAKRTREESLKGVVGRGGYVPVQGENEQIDEEEAKKIREQYAYGETGEGLTFDEEFYPYYAMLDDVHKSLYRQIYANANAVNGIFNPVEQISQGQLKNVFMAVFNDHPELFWLDSAYRGRFDMRGNCLEIVLQFNSLIDNLDAAKERFRAAAEEIFAVAEGLSTDYEVELYIHNALLDNIQYDLRAPMNQSAYSGMVNGKTVCAGYARSFQYLMMEMGIPCYYCTGYAGEAHAWNIVQLEGEYYNVDATWDDTDPNTYDYFNKTDAEFHTNHRREDLSVNLPACSGMRYSNLEVSPRSGESGGSYSNVRTLAEAGFNEDGVLLNLRDYYDDCYRQIMANGGSCTFQNVVDGENLWKQCYDAYHSDAYSGGYMDRVFSELGVDGCNVDIKAEPLRDGRFLLHHSIGFF